MKRIISLSILTLFLFCSSAQEKQIPSTEFFNVDNFTRDTLYIKSRFIECGEWGGHLEISKVYLKGEDIYINYQKFDADCNTIKYNNGETTQKLVQSITKILLDKVKLLIRRYMHNLVDAKFREPVIMHAGYIFEVKKTDSSINIRVYTWGETTKNEYQDFIRQLLE